MPVYLRSKHAVQLLYVVIVVQSVSTGFTCEQNRWVSATICRRNYSAQPTGVIATCALSVTVLLCRATEVETERNTRGICTLAIVRSTNTSRVSGNAFANVGCSHRKVQIWFTQKRKSHLRVKLQKHTKARSNLWSVAKCTSVQILRTNRSRLGY